MKRIVFLCYPRMEHGVELNERERQLIDEAMVQFDHHFKGCNQIHLATSTAQHAQKFSQALGRRFQLAAYNKSSELHSDNGRRPTGAALSYVMVRFKPAEILVVVTDSIFATELLAQFCGKVLKLKLTTPSLTAGKMCMMDCETQQLHHLRPLTLEAISA